MCLYDFIIPWSHPQWSLSLPCFLVNCNCPRRSTNLLSVNISNSLESHPQDQSFLISLTVHIFWMKMEFMLHLAQSSVKLINLYFTHLNPNPSVCGCSLLLYIAEVVVFHRKHALYFINFINILWFLNLISSLQLFLYS